MLKRARIPLQRVLGPLGQALANAGVSPNVVTALGALGVCASALICYPRGWLFWGSFAVTIFVLSDLVDGALARARGITGPWGAFLDSSLDRVADSAVFAGLIWWFARDGKPWLLGLSIFCLVAGNLVSYTRARAEGLGLRADVGVAERAGRTIVILVATGLSGLGIPFVQAVGLWLLAVASAITVGQRFAVVYRQATGSVTAGPVTPGPVTPGPVTPESVTPDSVTPGSVAPVAVTSASVTPAQDS